MKIVSASIKNFGSYKQLEFNFNKGLTLIHGPTGSGKSTLCDIIPWILFGKTSKGGSIDEIRSWGEKEPTEGIIHLEGFSICRIRGKSNDLFMFTEILGETHEIRGKDLNDTQKLINEKLGYDLQTYLSGSYLHEFSQTSQFFTTTAKVRRSITEGIVDLGLPIHLTESLLERRKALKSNLDEINSEILSKNNLLNYITIQEMEKETNISNWNTQHDAKVANLKKLADEFDDKQTKLILSLADNASNLVEEIKTIPDAKPCPTCGESKDITNKIVLESRLDNVLNQIETEENRRNPYRTQILNTQGEKNPFVTKAADSMTAQRHLISLNLGLESSKTELSDVEVLLEVIEKYRTTQIDNSVNNLQSSTNDLLSRVFDGEISVTFDAEDKDKLEATIYKDGNLASFIQLSKGQRQMIKLAFGVSVMKATAQHNAVNFDTLFFDECLDGMSDEIRLKAYKLFEELSLEYKNVFIVDHSESFKSCFVNKIMVELTDEGSVIC